MTDTADSAILEILKDPAQKDTGYIKVMDMYKEPIYWHIRRLVVSHEDAEDILQETFINVYRHVGSFRGESKIFTWIYRIATNECTKHLKNNNKWLDKKRSVEGNVSAELTGSDLESGEVILYKFQEAIQQLPKKQKIVFNLRYYDELSYEDIAKILNSSVSSSKTNYHLASEKIKKHLLDNA